MIDVEIKRLIGQARARATDILVARRARLDRLARELLEHGSLERDDLERLFFNSSREESSMTQPCPGTGVMRTRLATLQFKAVALAVREVASQLQREEFCDPAFTVSNPGQHLNAATSAWDDMHLKEKVMTVLLDQHPELWEKLHPHVPKETIVQTVREMTPAQRAYPYMPQAIIDATPWVEALKAV